MENSNPSLGRFKLSPDWHLAPTPLVLRRENATSLLFSMFQATGWLHEPGFSAMCVSNAALVTSIKYYTLLYSLILLINYLNFLCLSFLHFACWLVLVFNHLMHFKFCFSLPFLDSLSIMKNWYNYSITNILYLP